MDTSQQEFYSKPETEIWIAFDCRGPGARNHLHRERRAWGASATMETIGHGRVVLVIRPGGATVKNGKEVTHVEHRPD